MKASSGATGPGGAPSRMAFGQAVYHQLPKPVFLVAPNNGDTQLPTTKRVVNGTVLLNRHYDLVLPVTTQDRMPHGP